MKLHHIGIACTNIEEETQRLSMIHDIVKRTPIIADKAQNAELSLLTLADGTNIELVAGPAVETILKKKLTYYHLCFEVPDLDAEIQRLVSAGAILLSPPKPAPLFDNRLVAFLHVSYGIIELLSQK